MSKTLPKIVAASLFCGAMAVAAPSFAADTYDANVHKDTTVHKEDTHASSKPAVHHVAMKHHKVMKHVSSSTMSHTDMMEHQKTMELNRAQLDKVHSASTAMDTSSTMVASLEDEDISSSQGEPDYIE